MPNPYRVKVGDSVRYRSADGRFRPASVTAVTSQTAVKLALRRSRSDANYAVSPTSAAAGSPGQMTQLNANADVTKAPNNWPLIATTNVWKRY